MKKASAVLLIFPFFSCSKVQKVSFTAEALSQTVLSTDQKQLVFKDVLKKHEGKTVLIEVWASWCGDCIKAMPETKNIQKNNPEVDYIFISMDRTAADWLDGIDKYQIIGEHYIANDGMKGIFAKAIDLNWIPRYIIIDKTGKISLYNAVETDIERIDQTLKNLAN